MRFAACIEYNGHSFSGWQRQKHKVRTVQAELEAALSKVADSDIAVVTAGRTDSGVHATHQIVHFDVSSMRSDYAWCRGGNRFLDKDIRIKWVKSVEDVFHARFSASSRSYRFVIFNQPIQSALYHSLATWEYRSLDITVMQAAVKFLYGEHDFSSFQAAGCQAHSPIRTVSSIELAQQGEWIWLDITANAFLQHMVRNIAGSLIEIGCGKRQPDWIKTLLAEKDRTKGGITATPAGLYLVGVTYDVKFSLPSEKKLISYW